MGNTTYPYASYRHTTGHLLSGYCTGPFAARGEGRSPSSGTAGRCPCLPRPARRPHVTNLGPLLGLIGNVYPTFAMHFPPFRPEDTDPGADRRHAQLSVPGKVMAYTALGEVREDLCRVLDAIYEEELDVSMEFARTLARSFLRRTATSRVRPEDALASFQHWLGDRFVRSLRRLREAHPDLPGNLCLTGGCALNIKWNGMIRASGVFDDVWVPPFPNDSGSALGAACAGMVARTGETRLDWSVHSGPALAASGDGRAWGYTRRDCSVGELARLLHTTGEPVVVLQGRAELGPRALGDRSILAAAGTPP
ncbi:carbamoyltransferase N-terminal domain-containing protein [Streptomyces sp. M19]